MQSLIDLIKNRKILAVLGLCAVAYWFFFQQSDSSSSSITYQTQALTKGNVESVVNTSGAISPVISVEVGTQVSGLISELYVDFNSEVTKGQLIARIDDQDQLVKLEQVKADLISSEASLEQAEASLLKARTQLELDRKVYERQMDLYAKQLISQQDLEKIEAAFKISEVNLEVAKSQLTSAKARLTQTKAQLQQAELNVDRTYIRSPVDGIVIDRAVDIGQTVSASLSAPTLFNIAQNLEQIQIESSVDEADIGKIEENMPVRFRVDAFPDKTFNGVVGQVRKSAIATQGVVTYTVIIRADNPNKILLPGMTANVNIILGQRENVLRAPNAAVRFKPPEESGDAPAPTAANPFAAVAAGGMGVVTEGAAARPAGGAAGGDRNAQMIASLGLTDEQKASVEKILADSSAEMRALFDGGNAADARAQTTQIRERANAELKAILTPEQFEKYMASQGGGAGGMTRGEVWVLKDGKPTSVRVQMGLVDDQNTEIVTPDLKEGDLVITRAVRSAE